MPASRRGGSSNCLSASGPAHSSVPERITGVAWTPDGLRLVVTTRQAGPPIRSRIFLVDAIARNDAGSEPDSTELVLLPVEVIPGSALIDPDGHWLALATHAAVAPGGNDLLNLCVLELQTGWHVPRSGGSGLCHALVRAQLRLPGLQTRTRPPTAWCSWVLRQLLDQVAAARSTSSAPSAHFARRRHHRPACSWPASKPRRSKPLVRGALGLRTMRSGRSGGLRMPCTVLRARTTARWRSARLTRLLARPTTWVCVCRPVPGRVQGWRPGGIHAMAMHSCSLTRRTAEPVGLHSRPGWCLSQSRVRRSARRTEREIPCRPTYLCDQRALLRRCSS